MQLLQIYTGTSIRLVMNPSHTNYRKGEIMIAISLQACQMGRIGLVVSAIWFKPKYQTKSCRKAAHRALDFFVGW